MTDITINTHAKKQLVKGYNVFLKHKPLSFYELFLVKTGDSMVSSEKQL